MADVSEKELRKFGLTVGLVFIVIAFWPAVWRAEPVRAWALIPGVILVVMGLSLPKILAPVFRMWMKIGHVLGWINTRIILEAVFFVIIAPMGLIMRMFGWDSMSRTLRPSQNTYRVVCPPRLPSHMKHQFLKNQGEFHGRLSSRTMGLHEGAKKVLVASYYHCSCLVREPDCINARLGSSPFYLHVVLIKQSSSEQSPLGNLHGSRP